jgi:hypothetical protein
MSVRIPSDPADPQAVWTISALAVAAFVALLARNSPGGTCAG